MLRRIVVISTLMSLCAGSYCPVVGGRYKMAAADKAVQVRLPETTVGRLFARWLELFNQGDYASMRHFVSEQWETSVNAWMDPLQAFFADAYPLSRGLDILEIPYSSDHRIVVIARERLSELPVRITAKVTAATTRHFSIEGYFYELGYKHTSGAAVTSDRDLARQLSAYVTKLASAGEFSGAFALAKSGHPLARGAFGYQDSAGRIPNTLTTRFNLASVGKVFTAIAVCQLAERGKLALSDPVIRYLPNYPNRAVGERVTLHHLLTHTSGMGDFLEKSAYQTLRGKTVTAQDYLMLFANDAIKFDPGRRVLYSNAGFAVLGAIVERVSGKSFWDYVRDEIFAPAQMNDTGYNRPLGSVSRLATSYQNAGWRPAWNQGTNGSPMARSVSTRERNEGNPAEGGYSTVNDLLKLAAAIRSGKLLGREYTTRLISGDGELGLFGPASDHAYGLQHTVVKGLRVVGQSGGAPGTSADFELYLDSDYSLVVLSNYDPPVAELVAIKLRGMLARKLGTKERPPAPTLTGDVRMHENFRSKYVKSRTVVAYLPPEYSKNSSERYPVLYLQDGQNVFDAATSTAHGLEWRVDETAEYLIKSRAVVPLIIVGVYNGGEDRWDEYTPTPDAGFGAGGKADAYGRMLTEELKPFIDSHYRTLPDAAHTGLGGSSLGGLVSLYLALEHPQVFGNVASLSPALWWDDKMILRYVRDRKSGADVKIWLDVGTAEGDDNVKAVRLLRDLLVLRRWKVGGDLGYFEAEGAEHTEQAWAERVAPMLRYLFPASPR